jgi:hypothetical protein
VTSRRGFFASICAAFVASRFAKVTTLSAAPSYGNRLVNQLVPWQAFTNRSLSIMREKLVMAGWSGPSTLKIGDTVFVRKPQRFVGRELGDAVFLEEHSLHLLTPSGIVPPLVDEL